MHKTLTHALVALVVGTTGVGAKPVPVQPVPTKVPETPTEPHLYSKDVIRPSAHWAHTSAPKRRNFEVGPASWYGDDFDGRATASGESFDMYDLTCAHPRLPFGTWLRDTNLKNGRAVDVRVNDRGPMVHGRIIDLSYQAAEELGFHGRGVQRVRVEVVHPKTVAQASAKSLALVTSSAIALR